MTVRNPDRVVSSESEELILVDKEDQELGYLSKADCHDGDGRLHRAFSLFLFDSEGRLLLQQRAPSKRLWPGFWSNTCCSHPRRGETLAVATARRLSDELNLETRLEFVYRFIYQASFGAQGSEHELCHVFLGRLTSEPRPNQSEIASIRYVSRAALDEELKSGADSFTPWFKLEWEALKTEHAARLDAYTRPAGQEALPT